MVFERVRRRPGRDCARPACRRAARDCRRDTSRSTRSEDAPLPAPREERDLPVHGRRAQPPRTLRQQTAARQVRRHAATARAPQGLPGRVHQSELETARPQVQVRQTRTVRRRAVRAAASPGHSCRRHRHRQIDDDRRVQSRAWPDPDEHRLPTVWQAEPGRVDALRPGQRIAEPARLCRLQHGRERPQRRQLELGQRLPAHRLSRRAIPHQRRSRAVPLQPARRRRRTSTRVARRNQLAQPPAPRRGGRPGNRHANQLVRNGLPYAGRRAGSHRHLQGT